MHPPTARNTHIHSSLNPDQVVSGGQTQAEETSLSGNDDVTPEGPLPKRVKLEGEAGPSRIGVKSDYLFDPVMAGTGEDEYHFTPPEVVSNYLERHFRRGLSKKECSAMLKKDPKSNTPAGAPPEVDPYILTFWKISQLKHLQTALLYTAGPLAGLWSQIVEQDLHKDPEALIQVPIVLEALQ